MGYMRKDDVMKTLQEDRETTLACYNDRATREIVRFCYESMERELERLPQYVPESVVEQPKIYDVDKIVDQLEEQEFAESRAESEANRSGQQSKPEETVDENGFMNIPEGLEEELPFDQIDVAAGHLKEGVNSDGADRDGTR